jgi:thiol:disulfide interchange protein
VKKYLYNREMKKINILLLVFFLSGFIQNIPAQILDPVDWEFEYTWVTDKEIDLLFKAEIEDKWHLYSQNIAEGGPIPTSFTFTPSEHYRLSGKTIEVTKPETRHDPSFGIDIRMFSHEAIFKQRIILLTGQDFVLEGSIEYMSCDNSRCLPPKTEEFALDLQIASAAMKPAEEGGPLKAAQHQLDLGEDTTPAGESSLTLSEPGISSADETGFASSESGISSADDTDTTKKSDSRSLWLFFLVSFVAGLAALLTPCVFPMIPMTVTFFMREGRRRIKGIMIGLVFGLSIILIYTSIGFIVSLTSAGPDAANVLSTHWIPNLIFFILFIVFAASFLGMFELVLPGRWVNTSDRQADKGGYIGAFFMAFTLVLVSFSCTGPIVGALLVESAGGLALKPILGMFGFSLAFSLPFTLLSIFPSWLSGLPKSGGWLNSIKVVLGFIVLAFAFKFLSTIDQSYHLGILGRDIYLAIWIVIFSMLGFYLLGKLKFIHDSDLPHISVPRLFLSIASFAFVVYLIPGLFGAPLKGISSLLPPVTDESFNINRPGEVITGEQESEENSYSGNCGPAKYSDFLHLPYDLKGYFDYDEGMQCAKQLNKPVLLDFKGHSCSTCKVIEAKVWSDRRVLKRLRENFVIIALYVDDKTKLPESEWITSDSDRTMKKTLGKKNLELQITKFNTNTLPFYIIVDHNGNPLTNPIGYELDIRKYVDFLDEGIRNFSRSEFAEL